MTILHSNVDTHDVVELESDDLRVRIDVECGAHIFSIIDRATGDEVLFQDPRGLAGHVVGGGYELFPNAGPVSRAPHVPKHGDIRSARWGVLRADATPAGGIISVSAESAALPLAVTRTMTLDGRRLRVEETIVNRSDDPTPYLWGHHVTFGARIAAAAAITVASRDIVSLSLFAPTASVIHPDTDGASLDDLPHRDGGRVDLTTFPVAPAAERLFARSLKDGHASVVGERLRAELSWDVAAFPALWIWLENCASQGEPFRGATTGLALEPQASYRPTLEAALREGVAPRLAPRASADAWLELTIEPSRCPVSASTGGDGAE